MSTPVIRRLPFTIRPVQYETLRSYLGRLANLNHINYFRLREHLGIPFSSKNAKLDPRILHAYTGIPPELLTAALPELHPPTRSRLHPRFQGVGPVCVRCFGIHKGGVIVRCLPWHVNACPKHRIWFAECSPGWPNKLPKYLSLTSAPEILSAQQQHRRLIRKFGEEWTSTLFHIVRNQVLEKLQETRQPTEAVREVMDKVRPGWNAVNLTDPTLLAGIYPEVVARTIKCSSPSR